MPDHPERLDEGFGSDPLGAGWTTGAREGAEFEGGWVAPSGADAGHAAARSGWWKSPAVGVEPFGYISLAFESNVGKSSVYEGLKALMEAGELLNVGTPSRTRYVAWEGKS